MNMLEEIDQYYQGSRSPQETALFEKRMSEDSQFAGEVAFYIGVRQLMQEEYADDAKTRFRIAYSKQNEKRQITPVRKLWRYFAVAVAIAGIIFGVLRITGAKNQHELAVHYIADHLNTLSVTMGTGESTMQSALNLYNQKKYPEAQKAFQEILRANPQDFPARVDAGLVALQLGQYENALQQFTSLESDTRFANPALFYHALTLMKRNQPGDQEAAKKILQQVADQRLEGEQMAREWLR